MAPRSVSKNCMEVYNKLLLFSSSLVLIQKVSAPFVLTFKYAKIEMLPFFFLLQKTKDNGTSMPCTTAILPWHIYIYINIYIYIYIHIALSISFVHFTDFFSIKWLTCFTHKRYIIKNGKKVIKTVTKQRLAHDSI